MSDAPILPPAVPAFADPKVAAVFAAYPKGVWQALLDLRGLILEVAARTPEAGALAETLKWGQPAYLNPRSRIGTTIRIDATPARPGGYALYVHCQTSLADTYRSLYGDLLNLEGNRAILFSADTPLPLEAVRHCIALALTYRPQQKTAA